MTPPPAPAPSPGPGLSSRRRRSSGPCHPAGPPTAPVPGPPRRRGPSPRRQSWRPDPTRPGPPGAPSPLFFRLPSRTSLLRLLPDRVIQQLQHLGVGAARLVVPVVQEVVRLDPVLQTVERHFSRAL